MTESRPFSLNGEDAPRAMETRDERNELYSKVAKEFGPSLSRLAAAYESDPTHREDLLQDIHMQLWRSLETFAGQCSLRTWVYRVAHNTAAGHIRRQMRIRPSLGSSLDALDDLPQEFHGNQRIDESEFLSTVRALIQRLKPIDRDVLLLYLEGMEGSEIAEVVGISRSNVAQKVCRAKKFLQKHFTSGDNDERPK